MKHLSEETIIERARHNLPSHKRGKEIATIFTHDDVFYGVFVNDSKILLRNIYSSSIDAQDNMVNCHVLTEYEEFGQVEEADVWVGNIQFKTQISTSTLFVLGVNSPNKDAETYSQEWLSYA